MAIILTGTGISTISGKAGGAVYSRNRYGAYVKSFAAPVNPKTARQNTVRAVFASLMAVWQATLTAAQRAQWEAYATAVLLTNRLGQQIQVPGAQHFVRSNSLVLQAGLTRVDDGPAVLTLPETDPSVAVSAAATTQLLSVTFNTALPWANEVGGALMVYMSNPANPSAVYPSGPYRYAGKVAGAGTPPTSPQTFTAPFAVSAGQKVFCLFRVVRADGRVCEPFRSSGLVS